MKEFRDCSDGLEENQVHFWLKVVKLSFLLSQICIPKHKFTNFAGFIIAIDVDQWTNSSFPLYCKWNICAILKFSNTSQHFLLLPIVRAHNSAFLQLLKPLYNYTGVALCLFLFSQTNFILLFYSRQFKYVFF